MEVVARTVPGAGGTGRAEVVDRAANAASAPTPQVTRLTRDRMLMRLTSDI
jgi:hypothetical protein